jgi:hypothetical protein
MSQSPAKDKESRKEEKDNIFVDMLYNLVVYLPVLIFSWIVDRFSD